MPVSVRALGDAVRRARVERGLSQEALAERAGLGMKHVSEIERGRLNIRLTTLDRLATGLGLTMSELLSVAETDAGARDA